MMKGLKNNVKKTAFGGHCDKFNYTGAIVGVNTKTARIVTYFSTEITPFSPAQDGTFEGGGGEAGIWMGGMGLASDGNNRLFFVTVCHQESIKLTVVEILNGE